MKSLLYFQINDAFDFATVMDLMNLLMDVIIKRSKLLRSPKDLLFRKILVCKMSAIN